MKVELVKNSDVIGGVTPKYAILHDGKFVCGGETEKAAIDNYMRPNAAGTIQNSVRLGEYDKIIKWLTIGV